MNFRTPLASEEKTRSTKATTESRRELFFLCGPPWLSVVMFLAFLLASPPIYADTPIGI